MEQIVAVTPNILFEAGGDWIILPLGDMKYICEAKLYGLLWG